MEKHSCRTCRNLEKERKEVMECRLKGRYRYGCSSQGSGYVCGFLAGDEDLETLSCGLWHGQSERKTEKEAQKLEKELGESLQGLFDRWNEWYVRGCPEGKETDGVYLNRLRLAIKGLVERIEETLEEFRFPECYYSPLPLEIAENYMADTDSLVKSAERALYQYRNSPDYLWLESYMNGQKGKSKETEKAAVFFEHGKVLEEAISRNQYLWAKVDYLDWPHAFWGTDRYMGPKDNKILQTYLGVSEGGYKGLLEYQRKIREEQLKKRHKKQTDPWDRYLEQVPELPKDWDHWVDKEGIGQSYMFYDYSRKKNQKGYCSWCEKEVPIEKPRHKKEGVCPVCGHKIQFKARGRAGSFWTDKRHVYLLQECRDGMVLREFRAWRCYKKGEYENPDYICQEERRVIYGDGMTARTFYYGVYKKRDFRWIEISSLSYDRPSVYWQYFKEKYEGQLYGISLPDPECRGLMRTGLAQFARQREQTDPEQYLYHLRKKPYLERLVKCGLFRLSEEVYNGKTELKIRESSDFAKSIGIDRYRMKRLREHDGGSVYLKWLILEKHQGKEIPDSVIDYFSGYQMEPKDLDFISEQMSVVRIKNYLEKQHKLSGKPPKELLSTWEDYLSMSFRLRRDITREIFFKPRNLLESHDEAVELCGNKEIAMRAVEVTKKYPDVDKICQSVKEKFEFADRKYRIVAPEKVEDIMYEGQALRHCADSSDIYYERIQNRESYIMFLRKAEEPDKPYYTLEVEPDGTIRQKRTVGDRQNKDLEDAVVFLRKWQEEIQKRLTLEDYRLAKESSRLRVEEFKKLREEKAKIWHGHLQGQLLADVLERDLMEAVRSAEMGDRNFDVLGDGLVSENLPSECEERIKQEEQGTERKEELELPLAVAA